MHTYVFVNYSKRGNYAHIGLHVYTYKTEITRRIPTIEQYKRENYAHIRPIYIQSRDNHAYPR